MTTLFDGLLGKLESYFVSMRGVSSSHAVGASLACLAAMTRASGPGIYIALIDERGTSSEIVCREAENLLRNLGLDSIIGPAVAIGPDKDALQKRIEKNAGSILITSAGLVSGKLPDHANQVLSYFMASDQPCSALISRRKFHADKDSKFYALEILSSGLPRDDRRPEAHSIEISRDLMHACLEMLTITVGPVEFDEQAAQQFRGMQIRNESIDDYIRTKNESLVGNIAGLLAVNNLPWHPIIMPCDFVLALGLSLSERTATRGTDIIRKRYADAIAQMEAELLRLEADNRAQKAAQQKPGFKVAPESKWWALDDPRLEADRKAHRASRPPFH